MSTNPTGQGKKAATMVAPKTSPSKPTTSSTSATGTKMHRRSRSGCFTCRLRRKKCDEGKPFCTACKHLGLKCEYKRPLWWGNNEQRRNQKETIKNIIKRTKLSEKAQAGSASVNSPPGLSHSLPTSATYSEATVHTRAASIDSQDSLEYDFNQPHIHDPTELYQNQVFTPQFQPYMGAPYEVDIKTERQMFVNDIPTRRDSSTSTFSTFQPPPSHVHLPPLPEDPWTSGEFFETPADLFSGGEEGFDFNIFDFSHGPSHASQEAVIEVDDCDRPLLNHFIDNVLRLIFPILEINQRGSARSEVILPALESNKCYLHCCLSIAAIHLKSTQGIQSEQIDSDIMRHRYATVSELCTALNNDTDHVKILEATLGMIFFQCSVGGVDDGLPDIPWHQHFVAATSLVKKLELPYALVHDNSAQLHPPFNMTLTSWIDILGATMLGRAPQFANTYRDKHLSASTSGLCELMGCEDRMMYLISEIACLEALKIGNSLSSQQLCEHITLLGQQIELTEPPPGAINSPYSASGSIRPRQLSRNMTAIFRCAARIWLCSLVPGASRYDQTMVDLVARLVGLLDFIPAGPEGFDRSIVWPLLIGGSQSTPSSAFRHAFRTRCTYLGEEAEFGSFGRMKHVLEEVWGQTDANAHAGVVQDVHWRDVMQQKGWDYLLI